MHVKLCSASAPQDRAETLQVRRSTSNPPSTEKGDKNMGGMSVVCYCYKNGTVGGTRDCRYFAAVYLIVRIILLGVYAATLTALFCGVGLLILIALALSVAIIQPYRQDLAIYNTVDIVLILMMAAWYGSLLCAITADQTAHIHLKIFVSAPECRDIETALYDRTYVRAYVRTYVRTSLANCVQYFSTS